MTANQLQMSTIKTQQPASDVVQLKPMEPPLFLHYKLVNDMDCQTLSHGHVRERLPTALQAAGVPLALWQQSCDRVTYQYTSHLRKRKQPLHWLLFLPVVKYPIAWHLQSSWNQGWKVLLLEQQSKYTPFGINVELVHETVQHPKYGSVPVIAGFEYQRHCPSSSFPQQQEQEQQQDG